MALQDILAAITANADKRIADARAAHQRALVQLREESERNLAKKKQDLAQSKQQRMKQLEAKAQTHALSQKRNMLLQKKMQMLDEVYADVVNELCALEGKGLEELLRACVKRITNKGTIHPSAKHVDILKKICPSEQFTIGKHTHAKGGFIFVSKKEEQDFTFENIVENILRPKTELDVSHVIFP